MGKPLKVHLADTVANDLRRRLKRYGPGEKLPGVREVAKALEVSVPTVCDALHMLATEGWVTSEGRGRAWRKSTNPVPAPSGGEGAPTASPTLSLSPKRSSQRLLFISPQPLNAERFSGLEVLAELLHELGTSHWGVFHRVVRFTHSEKPRRSWDELLVRAQADALVVLGGTPVVAAWARAKGIKTLFLGGDRGDSGIPQISVNIEALITEALQRLSSRGHRRILLPLCARPPGFIMRCRNAVAGSGTNRKHVVISETPYTGAEVLVSLLQREWLKNKPDAVILLDWREFVAASSFFKDQGIMIPGDMSVVVLSQNANTSWHLPPVTHFEHPAKKFARLISKWLAQRIPEDESTPLIEIQSRWVEGKSVANRKVPATGPGPNEENPTEHPSPRAD